MVVLDQLDLGAFEDEMNLLDVALFELDLRQCCRDLPEGQKTRFLTPRDEHLDLVQFVKLSDCHLVTSAPVCGQRSRGPYGASLYSGVCDSEHPVPSLSH